MPRFWLVAAMTNAVDAVVSELPPVLSWRLGSEAENALREIKMKTLEND